MIAVACTGCGFGYKVSDDKTGKRFKCRECGEVCTVPAPQRRKPRSSSAPKKRRKPKTPARRDEWEDDTASSEHYESYDDYESYDNGSFDSYDDDAYEDYQPARSRRKSPSRSAKAKPKKKKRKVASDSSLGIWFENPLVWLGFPVAATLLTVAIMFVLPIVGIILAMILPILGMIISLIAGIRLLIGAFQEDMICGLLYLFVPFYSLYYLVTRWEDQRPAFLMNLCGTLLVIGAAFTLPAAQAARDKVRQEAGQVAIPIAIPKMTMPLTSKSSSLRDCGRAFAESPRIKLLIG